MGPRPPVTATHIGSNSASADDGRARKILVSAVWHGARQTPVDNRLLADAAGLARHNRVASLFAHIYSDRLPDELARTTKARLAFRCNLEEASRRLLAAGVQPITIKMGLDDGEDAYSNFDLVVGDDGWEAAIVALREWTERRSTYALEPGKLLLHPPSGPAAHLHRCVSWFEIPVVPTERLRARATRDGGAAWWTPAPIDELRIRVAHAAFQNLALDLADLVVLRRILAPTLVASARAEAAAEGWRRGFGSVIAVATEAIERLDAGEPLDLPVRLPAASSLRVGLEHATHLWRSGRRRAAVREGGLRLPLILAKAKRSAVEPTEAHMRMIGLSGPDGAGKTSTARALAHGLVDEGQDPLQIYLYGCVLCRRLPSSSSRHSAEDTAWEAGGRTVGRSVLRAHALVDVSECTIRLAVARLRARMRTRLSSGSGPIQVVVTERSPLDGLVKHQPAPNSVVGRWYLSLARRYGLIIWLDASADELATRDGEHAPDELERSRARFAAWAERLPNVERFDTTGRFTEAIASDVRGLLAERSAAAND